MDYKFSDIYNSMKKNVDAAYTVMGAAADDVSQSERTLSNLSGTIANALSNAGCFFLDAITEGDNLTVSYDDAVEAVKGIEDFGRSVILRIIDDDALVQVASPYITLKDSETPQLLFKHPESTVKAIGVLVSEDAKIGENNDRLPLSVVPLLIAGDGINLEDDGTINATPPTALVLDAESVQNGWNVRYNKCVEAVEAAKGGSMVGLNIMGTDGTTQITALSYAYSDRNGLTPKISFRVPEFPNLILTITVDPNYETDGVIPLEFIDAYKAGNGIQISEDGTISLL